MMTSQRLDHTITPALAYANQQIDHFSQRGRLTFSELSVMVEAIYAMSGVSGGIVFAYAVKARAKMLVIDERGFFTIHDANADVDHVIPSFLRELSFFNDYKIRFEDVKQFVPLFATGLGASSVLMKNIVWIKSIQRSDLHIPLLMGSHLIDASAISNNRHASVSVPVVYSQGGTPKCGLVQLPSSLFDRVLSTVRGGARNIRLRKAYTAKGSAPVELTVERPLPELEDKVIQQTVGEFWKKFSHYSETISMQNAKMPKNVVDTLTHVMINTQKSLPELSALIF